jgi:GTP-binding protein YchF
MQIGLVGAKFSGKTTLFNAITGASAPTGQGGVEAHRGIAEIPDSRLDHLTAAYLPRRQVNATVEWVDIPGVPLRPGEANGSLEHARRMDGLAVVVRCFDGGFGPSDPAHELEALSLDLILTDLQVVENRLERLAQQKQKTGKHVQPLEPPLMERFRQQLEQDRPLRDLDLNADERRIAGGFSLLTLKPMLAVLNLAEAQEPEDATLAAARTRAGTIVPLCARVEAELAELPGAEAREFLAALGVEEAAYRRMLRAAYEALALRSFFTVGKDECRAWTIHAGARAPEAAGAIHSDLERGFIRAEVCAWEDFRDLGGMSGARGAGKVRLEGKDYQVQDGDIMTIRFSV